MVIIQIADITFPVKPLEASLDKNQLTRLLYLAIFLLSLFASNIFVSITTYINWTASRTSLNICVLTAPGAIAFISILKSFNSAATVSVKRTIPPLEAT